MVVQILQLQITNFHQQPHQTIHLYYQMLQGQIQLLVGLFQALHIIYIYIYIYAQPIQAQIVDIFQIYHQHIYYLKLQQ